MSTWRSLGALDRIGVTTHVVKTALAAGISWQLALWLLGTGKPYLAPLAAILSGQATVAGSISRAGQRVLGVVGGLAVSLAAAHVLGLTAWSVAALVLIGMAMATALGFGSNAVAQVAVSGLLVLSLGAAPQYAARRLLDTMLGAGVAVVVNALVIPPDPTPAAEAETRRLVADIAALLAQLADGVEGGRRPRPALAAARRLSRRVEALRGDLLLARQNVLYSPLLRRRRRTLGTLSRAVALLGRLAVEARGLVRTLAPTGSEAPPALPELAGLLRDMALLVRRAGDLLTADTPAARRAFRAAAAAARAGQRRALGTGSRPGAWVPPRHWRDAGSVLADLHKMTQDLERAVGSRLDADPPTE
jgi:uncharacterized membrane protein YgaE (UPF0421/DUF939 family)